MHACAILHICKYKNASASCNYMKSVTFYVATIVPPSLIVSYSRSSNNSFYFLLLNEIPFF